MNLLTLVVYWGVIHAVIVDLHEGVARAHLYYVHILPSVAFAINFYLTDVKVLARHVWVIPFLALPMGYSNYRSTIANGKPLYWFLTWEDHTSSLIFLSLTIGAMLVFLMLSKMTIYVKTSKVPKGARSK